MMSGLAALTAMPIILVRLIYRVKGKANYLSQMTRERASAAAAPDERSTLPSSR